MNVFKSFKGRSVFHGQKVKVYRNLNKSLTIDSDYPVYSVQDFKSGLVVGHTECAVIQDAIFKVHEAGRQKVLNTGYKNVHAYIQGKYCVHQYEAELGEKVVYDPYLCETFMISKTRKSIYKANRVLIGPDGVYCI